MMVRVQVVSGESNFKIKRALLSARQKLFVTAVFDFPFG